MISTTLQRPTTGQSIHYQEGPRLPGREPRHISYGESALRSELSKLEVRADADRRHVYAAAQKMGNLIGGGELRRTQVEDRLVALAIHGLGLAPRDARRAVSDGIEDGIERPRTAPEWRTIRGRNDAILHWLNWWESIRQEDFPGTKGSSLLRLHAAFALAGLHTGKVDIGLSIRDIAQLSGFGIRLVWDRTKAGGEVEQAGYLKTVGPRARRGDEHSNRATTWRPLIKRALTRQAPSAGDYASGLSRKSALHSPALNVFYRRSNAWRFYGLLQADEEVTVAELAEVTGLSACAVRSNLQYLASVGLAYRVDRTHWRGTMAVPDEERPAPDGVDHAAIQEEKRKDDRDAYKAWKDARQAAREELAEQHDRERAEEIAESHARRIVQAFEDYEPEPSPVWDPETGECWDLETGARVDLVTA